ncbi:MAG: PEP-CTERM sorting domain-containing protein [Moorea sp. SIO2B7]|nr:PEP-CTERM sorting domain-containing protein [Moorena sp. SIO2B7]
MRFDANPVPVAVPEPSTIFSSLTTGVFGTFFKRKLNNKKKKKDSESA